MLQVQKLQSESQGIYICLDNISYLFSTWHMLEPSEFSNYWIIT